MVTLRNIVEEFAREAEQPIFLIDKSLADQFHDDDQTVITYMMKSMGYNGTERQDKTLRSLFLDIVLAAYTYGYTATIKSFKNHRIVGFVECGNPPILSRTLKKSVREAVKNPQIFDANTTDWRDFTLYHELFHLVDQTINENGPENDEQEHYHEFFADFGACLYMASKGRDMFLDVAKIRALDMQAKGLSDAFGPSAASYANHRIYAIFKKEKIDPTNMSLKDMIALTHKMTQKYAFKNHDLKKLTHFMTDLSATESKQRLERINPNNKRPFIVV